MYVHKVKVTEVLWEDSYILHEYDVVDRIKCDIFYDEYRSIGITKWGTVVDIGEYRIGEYMFYDINKIHIRDISLYQRIYEFNKIQNRMDTIDEIIK